MDDNLVVNAALTDTAAARFIFYHHNRCCFSGRVAQHGDHVNRKRDLLGPKSVSSDVPDPIVSGDEEERRWETPCRSRSIASAHVL